MSVRSSIDKPSIDLATEDDSDAGRSHDTYSTAPTELSHRESDWQERESIVDDGDSALGSISGSTTYTASTSAFRFHHENGRRYHAYHEGQYIMPNDELEQNKLYLAHLVNYIALDGALFMAPLDPGDVGRVLDVGTGVGEWAIDFAERYPSSHVLGTDLSPIQPAWVPENCTFEVDDANDEWLYNQPFRFIHTRTLCGGISDWPRFYESCLTHLEAGGWVELQENEVYFQRMDGTTPPNTDQFLRLLDEAAIRRGCRMNVAHEQKQHMLAAGFEDVHEVVLKLPLSMWHPDPKMKEIGRIRGAAMHMGVEGYGLALYTRYLKWSKEEFQILLAKVRQEFGDQSNQMYIAEHFVYGRKPGGPRIQVPTPQINMPPEMWEIR